jgi:hypothetical protein
VCEWPIVSGLPCAKIAKRRIDSFGCVGARGDAVYGTRKENGLREG